MEQRRDGDVVGPVVPESVGGMVDTVESPGGCPCWRDACDGLARVSLLQAFSVREGEGRHSEEYALPAVVRDRGVGGGAGGSWQGLVDEGESSAREVAGKLSLGPRESGIVSTGWSAASPELLEITVGAVIPRGRRTAEVVRERYLRSWEGEDTGVDGPGVEAACLWWEWMPLSAVVVEVSTRLAMSAEISAMAGMAWRRASRGDAEGSEVEGLGVPTPSCPHLKLTAGTRGPTRVRVVNIEDGLRGGVWGWRGSGGRVGPGNA